MFAVTIDIFTHFKTVTAVGLSSRDFQLGFFSARQLGDKAKATRATSMLAQFPAKKRQRVSEKEKPKPHEAAVKRQRVKKEREVKAQLENASEDGLGPVIDAIADNADKKADADKSDKNLSKPGPRERALLALAEQVRTGNVSEILATELELELELWDRIDNRISESLEFASSASN